jgi:uncharacterized Zn finger protein (UPF0148 family)
VIQLPVSLDVSCPWCSFPWLEIKPDRETLECSLCGPLDAQRTAEAFERDAAREERQEESDQYLEDLDANLWLAMREGL